MYVTEIELQDLRCFVGKHALSLDRSLGRRPNPQTYAGWTVLAGRNGSGKSTLLRAIAMAILGPARSASLAGPFVGWVRGGAREAHVAVALHEHPSEDRYARRGGGATSPFWAALTLRCGEGPPESLERALKGPSGRQGLVVDGPWASTPRGWFLAAYGPQRHLGPATMEVVRLSADPVLARVAHLFREDATLAEAVDWLRDTHHRVLEGKPGAKELLEGVLAFLRGGVHPDGVVHSGLLPDGSAVERVDSDGLWICREGVSLPLERWSDGYRSVTALVVDLLRRLYATYGDLRLEERDGTLICPLPGVVLIDEVDAHLHISWQQQIGFWLTRRFPAIQFLVTSHSPFVCQAASRRGIIRLPAPGEARRVEHVSESLFQAVIHGGADAAAMTELFGLEHAHSGRAESLREEVARLEARLLDAVATEGEVAQYQALKSQLPENMDELADQALRALLKRGSR